MNELTFGNLDAWAWAAVVLVMIWGFLWLAAWRRARLRELDERGPLPKLMIGGSGGTLLFRALSVSFASALLVLSLMRPQYGTKATEVKNLGIDIAVAIDASKSMKVQDIVPDRLSAARLEIHRMLGRLSGGRVALVPFAGLAFVQTPLTSDFQVIETYLSDLRVEDMPRGGTAIGRAILEGVRALVTREEIEAKAPELIEGDTPTPGGRRRAPAPKDEPPEVETEFSGSKHKALILFTDGEDHETDPLKAAEFAKRFGIRIYTVGVGTAQGRPVPMINEQGEVVGTVKGPDGAPLFSELNVELLRKIAQETGGEYFHLGAQGLGDSLIKAIDQLEKQEFEATFKELTADRYQWTLLPALLLLLIEALVGDARRRRRREEVRA